MAFVNEELSDPILVAPSYSKSADPCSVNFVCVPTIKVAHEPPRLEITNLRLIA